MPATLIGISHAGLDKPASSLPPFAGLGNLNLERSKLKLPVRTLLLDMP